MRVMVAAIRRRTRRTTAVDGKLVRLAVDPCEGFESGCDRGVAGLASGGVSPTFTVREFPWMTASDYRRAFADALTRQRFMVQGVVEDEAWLDAFVSDHLRLADRLEPNRYYGIRNFKVVAR